MRSAPCFTTVAPETFSEFPISPTRLILLARVFNQHQEFFIACGTKQRGLDDAAPPQTTAGGDELVQLAQHALVNRGITNSARSSVGFGLSSFKRRFDEGKDFTLRTE